MDRADKTILVTGATGRQGGAAACHLLDDGWHLRALVRDAEKPAARALAAAGVELAVGDLLDRASLDAAVAGAYGVYSVQTQLGVGPEGEERESRNLADAAFAAGVEHFVYSSVRGAETEGSMPWVASKHHNEEYIRSLGLPFTIWRPVTFMENFLREKADLLGGRLKRSVAPETPWQFIAVDDIGRFVAMSFRERDCWLGQATAIAGDEMPIAQAADVFARVLGRPVAYVQTPAAVGAPQPTPAPAGAKPPILADIATLRDLLPELKTLETWARLQEWRDEPAR